MVDVGLAVNDTGLLDLQITLSQEISYHWIGIFTRLFGEDKLAKKKLRGNCPSHTFI